MDTCPTCFRQGGKQKFPKLLYNMVKYFVYILKSLSSNKTYVGYTNDIERRIKEHNSGKSSFTSRFMPWEILYVEEADSKEIALKTEKYYKSAAGRRKIKKLVS